MFTVQVKAGSYIYVTWAEDGGYWKRHIPVASKRH
jgi:hypothetical protein